MLCSQEAESTHAARMLVRDTWAPAAQQQHRFALACHAQRDMKEQRGLAAALRTAQQAVAGGWREGWQCCQLPLQRGLTGGSKAKE